VSQYQNTLFGDMQSNADLKSSIGSRKYSGDAASEDVKQSERTNDMVAKRDPKR
jgi:hypothetical protein